jgi:predicted RNase H-related nuclease YkuK (DUF458 family)
MARARIVVVVVVVVVVVESGKARCWRIRESRKTESLAGYCERITVENHSLYARQLDSSKIETSVNVDVNGPRAR